MTHFTTSTTKVPSTKKVTSSTTTTRPSTSTTTVKTTTKRNEVTKELVCKYPGTFVNPNDCKKFYRCVRISIEEKYKIYEYTCPPNTVFDIDSTNCLWDYLVPNCHRIRDYPNLNDDLIAKAMMRHWWKLSQEMIKLNNYLSSTIHLIYFTRNRLSISKYHLQHQFCYNEKENEKNLRSKYDLKHAIINSYI